MGLSVLKPCDETRAGAWLLASAGSLIAAVWAFHRSTEFSVFLVGFSLLAIGICAGIATYNSTTSRAANGPSERPPWLPVGALSAWLGAVILLTVNPTLNANLNSSSDERRILIAIGVLFFSMVFQGRLLFFAPLPLAGLYVGLREMDLRPSLVLSNASALWFMLSFPIASLVMMIRSSRSDSHGIVAKLKTMISVSQDLHARVQVETEALANLRENLLGTVASMPSNESKTLGSQLAALNSPISILREQPSLSFDRLIAEVRQIFSEFQIQGRALGKIAGPIRFVFFPPVAGFDEQSEIAVDIQQLRSGLWNCLQLAYESLPETGALRREGVIRLSMRHGFRVVEIAVEDNGRGIQTKSLDADHGLHDLKNEVESRGGRFERVARLGVGSRTSMELRILSEKPASSRYRATIRHPFTVAETNKEPSPSGGAQLV